MFGRWHGWLHSCAPSMGNYIHPSNNRRHSHPVQWSNLAISNPWSWHTIVEFGSFSHGHSAVDRATDSPYRICVADAWHCVWSDSYGKLVSQNFAPWNSQSWTVDIHRRLWYSLSRFHRASLRGPADLRHMHQYTGPCYCHRSISISPSHR